MHGTTRTGPWSKTGAAEKQKQRDVPQTCTTALRRVSGTYTLVAGRSYL